MVHQFGEHPLLKDNVRKRVFDNQAVAEPRDVSDLTSDGVSINIVAELDETLLARPADLQRQIAPLYAHAQQASASRRGPA